MLIPFIHGLPQELQTPGTIQTLVSRYDHYGEGYEDVYAKAFDGHTHLQLVHFCKHESQIVSCKVYCNNQVARCLLRQS